MLFIAEFLSGLGVMILDSNVGALMMAFTPRNLLSRATATLRFGNYDVRSLGALAGVVWLLPSDVPGIRELPEETA